jgi:hypothetical protein
VNDDKEKAVEDDPVYQDEADNDEFLGAPLTSTEPDDPGDIPPDECDAEAERKCL